MPTSTLDRTRTPIAQEGSAGAPRRCVALRCRSAQACCVAGAH